MAEEIKKEMETEQEQGAADYIDAMQKLKDTTVPKDEYNKLKDEHKKLLDAYVEGKDYDGVDLKKKENELSLEEIESKLFAEDNNLSNLEYAKMSLAHRNLVLEQTGYDEYVPQGEKLIPEDSDYETANRVAEALQYCIDYAEGDSAVFTNELQRIMIDTGSPVKTGRRK